ncbi:MAG: TIGR02391 family protein [Nitrososphaera sp.]|nr:TIGR02391 family protein [Nitrososphaera sp.]
MEELFRRFEWIVRRAGQFTEARGESQGGLHPFEERNIHPGLPIVVRRLFDDGHYSQSTFEAFKFIDKEVQRHSRSEEAGFKLMMQVLSETSPAIRLTALTNTSDKDEQKGFQFLFAGSVLAIRNPRGHEVAVSDAPDQCLDHLGLASILLRRLEESGYKCSAP